MTMTEIIRMQGQSFAKTQKVQFSRILGRLYRYSLFYYISYFLPHLYRRWITIGYSYLKLFIVTIMVMQNICYYSQDPKKNFN